MRRHRPSAFLIVAWLLIESWMPAYACGEKLLVLGRGVRFQARHTRTPASVLLFVPDTASGRPLSDPNLETALREAGHAVRAVATLADLEDAMRSGSFDVVLVNITDAPELERARAAVDRQAFVLPAVYLVEPVQKTKQQTQSDRVNASKAFGVVVEVPGRAGHYCAAVDKAMELKLKRERAAARRP